ncbi:MAG: hypothetical protein J7L69_03265 [Desulfobulbaceae bacterium]|nr:hypothetical protein [Desulfobulbaceae bacterium]
MPKIKTDQTGNTLVILIFLVLIVSAGLLYFFWNQQTQKKEVIDIKKSGWDEQIAPPEKKYPLHQYSEEREESEESEENEGKVEIPVSETTYKQAPVNIEPADPCRSTEQQLDNFFNHLDGQAYFQAYKISGGSKKFFREISLQMSENPPSVTRETDNLFTILKNTAHFYRVLGGENIKIIKNILTNEDEIIETTMAHFYQWSELDTKCKNPDQPRLPVESLYNYAGFFLNTLGGQSYLFRRKIKIRMLTRYYCILILDRANEQNTNQFGIDIRYPINSLLDEMEVSQGLKNRDKYVDRLDELARKYDKLY